MTLWGPRRAQPILGDSITAKAMAVYTETACCGPVGVGRENTFVQPPSASLCLKPGQSKSNSCAAAHLPGSRLYRKDPNLDLEG